MSQTKLLNLLAIAITTLCLIVIPHPSQAAPKGKSKVEQSKKEKVILMPMDITVEDRSMISDMQNAVEQGLRQKYQVFSGEAVLNELKKAADKQNHSKKTSCDETKCLQDVAMAFDNAYVAMVHVKQITGGYTLSISILDVFTNETVFPNQISCEGCNPFQLLSKLKELVGAPATVASAPAPAPEAPQAKINQNDPDAVLWEEVKKGNEVEDYQAYLSKYPKGKFAPLAKAKLARLKDETRAAAEQQDKEAWATAQQGANQDSYATYLSLYPQGQFAALAQGRIDKVKREEAAAETTQRREQAAAEAKRKQEQIAAAEREKREAGNGPAMVRIPGKNYEMGKYDVTQKEWQAVMGTNPSHFSSCGDTCPVEKVSWNDAHEFLQKLNAKTGRQYRLPNEEEWEYACYGGNKTEYCGSNDLDSVAWYNKNSNNTTHPVGQKQANGYGLYDMSGNVWQWMENKYDNEHDWRALRGGSGGGVPVLLRAAYRLIYDPTNRGNYIGFRLARTLP